MNYVGESNLARTHINLELPHQPKKIIHQFNFQLHLETYPDGLILLLSTDPNSLISRICTSKHVHIA